MQVTTADCAARDFNDNISVVDDLGLDGLDCANEQSSVKGRKVGTVVIPTDFNSILPLPRKSLHLLAMITVVVGIIIGHIGGDGFLLMCHRLLHYISSSRCCHLGE